ncbi:MAG: flagellar M-ring protein FliF [Treponema sp.]|nr:flagellar M-ring protein FliF [Treponema sp.]
MNEWLKKVFGKLKDLWSKWKPIQKVILIGIVVIVIVAIILAARVSSKPSTVRVFNAPVTDSTSLTKILDRISQENVQANADSNGYISVADDETARRIREVLISENLVPSSIDPWAGFYDRSWSTTDADQNVKLKNTIQKQLKAHIEAISDVQMADVNIVLPERQLFAADQAPVSASVILRTTPSSTLLSDKKRIQGIQRLILSAVEGLKEENLIISDSEGNQINDFEGMAEYDRLSLTEKTERFKLKLATEIRAKILKLFQNTYGEDRCRDMVVTIEMDTSQKTVNATEYTPIVIKEDNPDTPYDDSEYRDTLTISGQTIVKEWQGTGYNPEGPAGVEGQTPPVYSDMSNVIGKSTETGNTFNNVINTKQTQEVSAAQIDKIAVSVNLDGKWKLLKDKNGKPIVNEEDGSLRREYTALTPVEIADAERSIQGAIGYDRNRGDTVVVTNMAYDRDREHEEEDAAYFAKIQRQKMIVLILIAVVVVLLGFILFRVISKEIERRRREREARLLAEQQAARERALWDAKDEGMEVTMSVEETRRMELQENAITMAKEHPEDVAMLIRTWLMEE